MFGFQFADVKPTVLNFLIVGLMAIAFISLAKFAVNKYDNPVSRTFRELVNSV